MNQYEVMYIIDTALEDQARADLIERYSALVAANGGQVDRIDEWGKRRLAYPINYKTDGYYVLMYMTAPSDLPRELERNFKIADAVLRYLVVRFEGELPPKREPVKSAPAPQIAEAPAPEAPAETPTDEPVAETPVTEAPVAEITVAETTPEAVAEE